MLGGGGGVRLLIKNSTQGESRRKESTKLKLKTIQACFNKYLNP